MAIERALPPRKVKRAEVTAAPDGATRITHTHEPAAPVRARRRTPSVAPGGQSADVSVVRKAGRNEVARREDHKARGVPLEEGNHATVGISGKVTFQPAPYESITVSVALYMPCAPTFEAADRMYAMVSNWVDQRLQHEVAVAKGEAEPVPLELPEQ